MDDNPTFDMGQGPAAVSRKAVEAVVAEINHLLQVDAGWIELLGITDDGVVRVQFGGLCVGCQSKPLTAAFTVKPRLLDVPGVRRVEVAGTRLSREAQARIVANLRRTAQTA